MFNFYNKTKKGLMLLSLFIILLSFFYNVFPAKATQAEINWPTIPGAKQISINGQLNSDFTITDLVKYLFNFAITIGGLVAFARLVYGGFRYLTSTGNPSVQKDAEDIIRSALLGLLLLLGSYLLLQVVNPDVLKLPDIKQLSV